VAGRLVPPGGLTNGLFVDGGVALLPSPLTNVPGLRWLAGLLGLRIVLPVTMTGYSS
jgi:prepilin-type processing-associated H-X9-DG protein